MAYLAAELDPEHTDAYFASALAIAQNREVAGLHYLSDTAAGKLLAVFGKGRHGYLARRDGGKARVSGAGSRTNR